MLLAWVRISSLCFFQPLVRASLLRPVSCKIVVVEETDVDKMDVTVDGQPRIDDWLVREEEVSLGVIGSFVNS